MVTIDFNFQNISTQKSRRAYLKDRERMEHYAPKTLAALDLIAQHSALGHRLIEWVKAVDITFGERPFTKYERGYGYIKSRGRRSGHVEAKAANSVGENVVVAPHEIFHGKQHLQYGLMSDYHGRPQTLYSRALQILSEEAAAETCAQSVLHQMRRSGYEGTSRAELGKYAVLQDIYEEAYETARADGDEARADHIARCAVHKSYYTTPLITAAYINYVFIDYLCDVNYNFFKNVEPSDAFGADRAHNLTQVGKNSYLVDKIDLPSLDDILGGDTRKAQAFAAAELWRLEGVDPRGHGKERGQALRQYLQAAGNPYINLSPREILHELKQVPKSEEPNVFKIMDELVKVKPRKPRPALAAAP